MHDSFNSFSFLKISKKSVSEMLVLFFSIGLSIETGSSEQYIIIGVHVCTLLFLNCSLVRRQAFSIVPRLIFIKLWLSCNFTLVTKDLWTPSACTLLENHNQYVLVRYPLPSGWGEILSFIRGFWAVAEGDAQLDHAI